MNGLVLQGRFFSTLEIIFLKNEQKIISVEPLVNSSFRMELSVNPESRVYN